MSSNKGFFQKLTSWKTTASIIAISFFASVAMNQIPGVLQDNAVTFFCSMIAAALGIHFLGYLLSGNQKTEKIKVNAVDFEKAKDPILWLKSCDSRRLFVAETEVIAQTYERITVREQFFSKYEADSPFAKSYNLIKTQALSDIKSCGQFMSTFHPSSSASKSYLYELMKNSRSLAGKLDSLVEKAIANESIVDDVDTTYVDDLLESLEELKTRQI